MGYIHSYINVADRLILSIITEDISSTAKREFDAIECNKSHNKQIIPLGILTNIILFRQICQGMDRNLLRNKRKHGLNQ